MTSGLHFDFPEKSDSERGSTFSDHWWGERGKGSKDPEAGAGGLVHMPPGRRSPAVGTRQGFFLAFLGGRRRRVSPGLSCGLPASAEEERPAGSSESPASSGALPALSPAAFHGEPPPHPAIPKARGGNRLGTKKSASLHTNPS